MTPRITRRDYLRPAQPVSPCPLQLAAPSPRRRPRCRPQSCRWTRAPLVSVIKGEDRRKNVFDALMAIDKESRRS